MGLSRSAELAADPIRFERDGGERTDIDAWRAAKSLRHRFRTEWNDALTNAGRSSVCSVPSHHCSLIAPLLLPPQPIKAGVCAGVYPGVCNRRW